MAMYLKLQGEDLPDFMMWSGLTELPWFWKPFKHLWFALPMVVLVPVAVAVIIGIPTFRARIKGSYFAILTQALALVFSILFIGQQPFTGGPTGLPIFRTFWGNPCRTIDHEDALPRDRLRAGVDIYLL